MTYRQAWDTYLEPHLKEREAMPTNPTPRTAEPLPVEVQRGLIDQVCAGRVYEGEKWWLPVIEANEKAAREKAGK